MAAALGIAQSARSRSLIRSTWGERHRILDDSPTPAYVPRFPALGVSLRAPFFEIHRNVRSPQVASTERETHTVMANSPQARKRIRRNNARAEVNGARMSRIRSHVKNVESACEAGDKVAAAAALKDAQPELARGVARGVMHKNTVARKMSRLSKRIAAL